MFSRDGRHVLTASNDKTARLWDLPDALTLDWNDMWDWLRVIALRPLTWEERREASLVDDAPTARTTNADPETAWLSQPVDMVALKAAAERGSWGANLRLGELHELAGDRAAALRAYAMAAERLDFRAVQERSQRPGAAQLCGAGLRPQGLARSALHQSGRGRQGGRHQP
jgi:hypothetical protein